MSATAAFGIVVVVVPELVTNTPRNGGTCSPDATARPCPDRCRRGAWACGPAGLLDTTERLWAAAYVRERLRVERFQPAPVRPPGGDVVGGRVRFGQADAEAAPGPCAPEGLVGERVGRIHERVRA
ncbi:hypothetical protein ACFVTY_11880 [Streptomyces sp. NPDC058067]|uniref:hypothetical protein n=1 Tax=Streptomyces sp. NPDC058067 TaxID=3346324 RepID=UPI0036EBD102